MLVLFQQENYTYVHIYKQSNTNYTLYSHSFIKSKWGVKSLNLTQLNTNFAIKV